MTREHAQLVLDLLEAAITQIGRDRCERLKQAESGETAKEENDD